jgi:hypothetical protein
MHRQLRRWLAEVGQIEHAEPSARPLTEPAAGAGRFEKQEVRSA